MGLIFRKSFKVAPGVRLNVSKRGMGVSVGARNGPRVSVNSSGRVTKSVRLASGLRWQETSTLGNQLSSKTASRQGESVEIPNEFPANQEVDFGPLVPKEPRSLFLPHSIWSVLFFAIGGFISATQESYDKVAFFIVAIGLIFGLTYLWNSFSPKRE